jgi:hypothetical protein
MMIRRTRELALVLLAASPLSLTGCIGAAATVAKQAFKEVRGAHADVLQATDMGRQTLGTYRGIEFTPATTSAGRLCPVSLLRAYDRAARQLGPELASTFAGGAPTLTVDSDILYFQGKGMLSGAFMLTRVKLRDGERTAGELFVRAESESFHAGGEDALASASVNALGKFLKARGAARGGAME